MTLKRHRIEKWKNWKKRERKAVVEDQKLENLLTLALETDEEEREKSVYLRDAYDRLNERWEIIVKYNGNIGFLEGEGILVTELYGGFAILNTPAGLIRAIANLPQIEYVEVPKRLYFGVNQGKTASCIPNVRVTGGIGQRISLPENVGDGLKNGRSEGEVIRRSRDISGEDLTGRGVYVGIVDSGIDLAHPDFRNADGTTRVKWLWDQTATEMVVPERKRNQGENGQGEKDGGEKDGEEIAQIGNIPLGYHVGLEYSEEEINRLLAEYDQTPPSRRRPLPGADNERHGIGVAGIAAGNGRDSEGRFTGVAPESRLIVVKLGLPDPNGFPRTAELMQGLNYVIEKAAADRIPVAINVSVGNTYGAHDGSTLLERYMDQAIGVGRTQIIVGSGNEGDTGGHASGRLENPVRGRDEVIDIELAVGPLQAGLNIQLWKNYADAFEISLVLPSGRGIGPFTEQQTVSRYDIDTAFLLVLYGEPSPYRTAQEIYLDFLPTGDYLESGIYRIRLRPVRIVDGVYHLWLPGANARTDTTRFLQPTPEVTLTIPSTSERGITVSAYDSNRETYGTFSGRGFTRVGRTKPDLAAPGVDVVSAAPGGGYGEYTGTSFAAPFVTGSAALLMEWGIVRGNDPFLYGEKIKAYLIRGARELPAIAEYPDPQVGWGTLCLRESIPK